jgi:type IV pilus assembly protein PilP
MPSDKLVAATSKVPPTTKPIAVPVAYNPTGKIDPFEPLYKDQPVAVKKKKRKIREPQTPLERIDLSQLKLVGIILASSGNRALVEESSGKGYVIKKGTYIGMNSGKVVNIKKEKVVVEEEFEDVFGKTKFRHREIKLPKPPGEF